MIGWDWLTIFCALLLGLSGFGLLFVFLRDSYRNIAKKDQS